MEAPELASTTKSAVERLGRSSETAYRHPFSMGLRAFDRADNGASIYDGGIIRDGLQQRCRPTRAVAGNGQGQARGYGAREDELRARAVPGSSPKHVRELSGAWQHDSDGSEQRADPSSDKHGSRGYEDGFELEREGTERGAHSGGTRRPGERQEQQRRPKTEAELVGAEEEDKDGEGNAVALGFSWWHQRL